MSSDTPQVFVGIDVAKEKLDVHVFPSKTSFVFDNTTQGIASLVEKITPLSPVLIVLEATGRFERRVAFELMNAGHEVAIVNPRQPRDFAKASGQPIRSTRRFSPVSAPSSARGRAKNPLKISSFSTNSSPAVDSSSR
jgi:transposase